MVSNRVSFSFLPKGGQNGMCELLGGGGHAPSGNFDFGPFIRRNLVESGTVFTQT